MSQLAYELELPPLSPLAPVAPVASLGLVRAQRAVDENRFEDALA
jgi:hypothetical protein